MLGYTFSGKSPHAGPISKIVYHTVAPLSCSFLEDAKALTMAIKRIEQLEHLLNAKAKQTGNEADTMEPSDEEVEDTTGKGKDEDPIVTPDGEAVSCPKCSSIELIIQ